MRFLSVPLLSSFLAITLVACGPKERVDASSSSTATYDVVSEGDASGVASTINAPGEVTPPMTATNADTTTNLAITGQQPAPTATNGNLAGALPTTSAAPAPVYIPPTNAPNGVMRRSTMPPTAPPAATSTYPRPVPTQTYPEQVYPTPSRPRPQPSPPTDTAAPPPTTTDSVQTDTTQTTQTDTTQTSQSPRKTYRKKKDEAPPPPPPPPDTTDTTGTNPG